MSESFKVLIVDDDFQQAEMKQEFLRVSGPFNVELAESLAGLWRPSG